MLKMRVNFILFCALLILSHAWAGEDRHYIATQYWTFLGDGARASSVQWDVTGNYGTPVAGEKYYSGDRYVAEEHIRQMLEHGINVLSIGWFNQQGDQTVWSSLDPDKAFQEGPMQAYNFQDIKFAISYDICTRSWLVHQAENLWGNDVLPGLTFYDPLVAATGMYPPSYDFSLSSNGKYIYDELLSFDFDYLARTYFSRGNYLKIGNKHVVFIYDSWRFNNGKNADLVNGFGRALNRIRTELYNKYGIMLYLVGDFAKYSATYLPMEYANGAILSRPEDYKNWGYLQQYDAIGSWNILDGNYFARYGSVSLGAYTDMAEDVNNEWINVVLSEKRKYRMYLSEDAKLAYGSQDVRLDYIPLLAFSFWGMYPDPDTNMKMWSLDTGLAEVTKQADMVRRFRERSLCAEEDKDLVYQVAWNQWSEAQIMELAVQKPGEPYPGGYYDRYLNSVKDILATDNSPPQVLSVSPESLTAKVNIPVDISATYADSNGWQDIQHGAILINSSFKLKNCFLGYYNHNSNKLYIRNNANTAWLGGFSPGANATIENSYARLNCRQTVVTGSGANLTIKWNITFKSNFTGAKNTYLYVRDDANSFSGPYELGTCVILP
ncbi:MAG: hypothetical protein AB1481_02745 [Candidatus Omnitrophota bacterium]